jgi:hypothetical protein
MPSARRLKQEAQRQCPGITVWVNTRERKLLASDIVAPARPVGDSPACGVSGYNGECQGFGLYTSSPTPSADYSSQPELKADLTEGFSRKTDEAKNTSRPVSAAFDNLFGISVKNSLMSQPAYKYMKSSLC